MLAEAAGNKVILICLTYKLQVLALCEQQRAT
jgi:hypothetical protein